ncbi:TPA: hypothetical protein ACNUUR_001126 [Aeromonas salmonicida]
MAGIAGLGKGRDEQLALIGIMGEKSECRARHQSHINAAAYQQAEIGSDLLGIVAHQIAPGHSIIDTLIAVALYATEDQPLE